MTKIQITGATLLVATIVGIGLLVTTAIAQPGASLPEGEGISCDAFADQQSDETTADIRLCELLATVWEDNRLVRSHYGPYLIAPLEARMKVLEARIDDLEQELHNANIPDLYRRVKIALTDTITNFNSISALEAAELPDPGHCSLGGDFYVIETDPNTSSVHLVNHNEGQVIDCENWPTIRAGHETHTYDNEWLCRNYQDVGVSNAWFDAAFFDWCETPYGIWVELDRHAPAVRYDAIVHGSQ